MRRLRGQTFQPGTAISLLALFVALGGTAFAATGDRAGQGAGATVSEAISDQKLRVRQASIGVDGGTANGNYNSRTVEVKCKRGEVALSVSTQWDSPDNNELSTVFARLSSTRSGTPNGAVARGSSDTPGVATFRVQVLCAG